MFGRFQSDTFDRLSYLSGKLSYANKYIQRPDSSKEIATLRNADILHEPKRPVRCVMTWRRRRRRLICAMIEEEEDLCNGRRRISLWRNVRRKRRFEQWWWTKKKVCAMIEEEEDLCNDRGRRIVQWSRKKKILTANLANQANGRICSLHII